MSKEVTVNAAEGGQAATRDINNQTTVINLPESISRCLVRAERVTLNKMVCELEELYGEKGRETWCYLHSKFGTENIEQMRIEHLAPTLAILELKHEVAALRRAQRPSDNDGGEKDLSAELQRVAEALAVSEQLRAQADAKLRQANEANLRSRKRANWLSMFAVLAVVSAASTAYIAYDQAGRAAAVEASLMTAAQP